MALSFAASISLISPASAETMKVTYTGTIFNSFDHNDLFGTGNTSLDGLSYVMEFIYDTAQAGYYNCNAQNSNAYGGQGQYRNGNPVLSSTFMIGGHVETVDGDYSGRVGAYNTGTMSGLNQFNQDCAFDAAGYEYKYLSANILHLGALFSASLDAALPLTLLGPGLSGLGSFYFGTCTYDRLGNCTNIYQFAHGSVNFSSVQVSQAGGIAPVPCQRHCQCLA